MVSTVTQSPFKNASIRLASRSNFVIFPIDQRDFFEGLRGIGFTVAREPPSGVPFGITATIGGNVARIDGMVLDMDIDRQVIGLQGPSMELVIEKFGQVEKLLNDRFGLNLAQNIRFYEIIASFQLETGKVPVDTLGKLPGFEQVVKSFGSVMGRAVVPFALRVRLSDSLPNDEEWFEMTIEPLVINPKLRYYITTVFRSPDRNKVLGFARELQIKIPDVVKSLESMST
jgi:hypothetical protein